MTATRSTPPLAEQLDLITAYCRRVIKEAGKATPERWNPDQDDETYWVETPEGNVCDCNHMGDATFIASARTACPAACQATLDGIEILLPAIDRDMGLARKALTRLAANFAFLWQP